VNNQPELIDQILVVVGHEIDLAPRTETVGVTSVTGFRESTRLRASGASEPRELVWGTKSSKIEEWTR
jgi:hypothetical protein